MSFYQSFCPACGDEFSSDRMIGESIVCRCGWTDNRARAKAAQKSEKRVIVAYMVFSVLFLTGYGHMVRWGSHAASVPFLKVAQLTGLISRDGIETMISACRETGRIECVEEMYAALANKTGDAEAWARLGSYEIALNRTPQALAAYGAWARAGGKDATAGLQYAQLLEKNGSRETAIQFYAQSIENSGERLPLRATTALVRLLMEEQRYQEAYDHITAFHSSAGNASIYLKTELEQLESALKKPKKMAAR